MQQHPQHEAVVGGVNCPTIYEPSPAPEQQQPEQRTQDVGMDQAPSTSMATLSVPQSGLMTCKPLDRVASTSGTSSHPSPPYHGRRKDTEWVRRAQARKGMERIASHLGGCHAPPAPPIVLKKRARSFSDPPESHRPTSVQAARNAAKYFRGLPRKKMRVWTAKDAAEAAEGERIMRQIRGRATDHFIAAAREPPVNMRSLRVLDTNEVLRLPQMRHDLLFDNFGFRPIHNPMAYTSTTNYGLLSTISRSQIVHPSPACETSNRYWDCIRAEVEIGCRCTRWDNASPARLKECICGRWKEGLSEEQWWRESRATWPSRLPKLVQSLREILESLMASTTPCVNHYAHSLNRDNNAVHTGVCPTVTHSLVPTLFAALDPEFLTIQVRRGNFDTDIFRVIGEAMKVHCAPVRDSMVDDMVATATGCDGRVPDVVSALRKCFDCAEVMKLDIANHQVQSLKGMLWQQAEQNEMTTFIHYLVAAGRKLESSKTYAWINAASKRVAMTTAPRARRHLMGQCSCSSNTEFVIRSLTEGFIDLVFGDWVEDSEAWPPVVPSRCPGSPSTGQVFPTKVIVPELFKMDSCRLKNFHAEMVDIAIAKSILSAFKEHYLRQNPTASAEEIEAQVAQVRESYKHVMTLGNGLARTASDCPSDLSLHMAHRIVFAREVYATGPRSQAHVEVVNRLAQDFDRLIADQFARRDSETYLVALKDLRQLVSVMLTNSLLVHRVQPESFLYDMRGVDARPCVASEQCETAASPRLRVPARRFVTLTEPLTGQGPSTSDEREHYHRPADSPNVKAARERFKSTVADSTASESEMATRLGFDPLVHEIRAVVARMVKTADFNLCVFANLYGRQGMLIGSGDVLPLPELSQI